MTHRPPVPGLVAGADLDRAALRALVADVAARAELWRPLVRADAGLRHFEALAASEHVEVWVISWMSGHDTGFHDHDLSCGAVAVVRGEIVEERLSLVGATRSLLHRAGDAFDFDASHVHRMHQASGAPAVSIHAYSPPLRRLGAYVVAADGTLRRRSISAAEELRPLETAA